MPPTKRKRTPSISACLPATAGIAPPPPMDAVQPSSRDASDEGAEDVVLQAVAHKKERQADGSSVVKRARVAPPAGDGQAGSDSDSDAELGGRASKKSRRTASLEHGENGEAGTLRMEPPPKAGLVDPVGYKTNPPPQDRAVRIYADGVFDLFHIGHMRALQQAKMAFDRVHLIVGVTGNKETHKRKGLTVLSAVERAESVRHCKWVDEVIEDCPWIVTADFLLKHHIDYVAHDDLPYGADEGDDIYGPIKEKGMFLVTQRTEGLSTTGIITKIVRDYDQYIDRQLKRGASRKELNVSWLKKNELDIRRNMVELRDSIKANWATTGQELSKDFRQFWQSSRPASPARTPTREAPDAFEATAPTTARSPSALSRLNHLDIPRANEGTRGSSEFAAGYNLGLIGGVRSWMARSRRNLNDSRAQSPSDDMSSDELEPRSPHEAPRGRTGKQANSDAIDTPVA